MIFRIMYSMFPQDCKKKSLEDNVYFTLKEIFMNCDSYETCMRANYYNGQLTGDVYYEDRTSEFTYTKVLQEKEYLESLCKTLNAMTHGYFVPRFILDPSDVQDVDEDIVDGDDDGEDTGEYAPKEFDVPFEEWWASFDKLRKVLNERLEGLQQ